MVSKIFKFSEKDFLNGKNILDLEADGTFQIYDGVLLDVEASCITFTGVNDAGEEFEFWTGVDIPDDYDLEGASAGDIINLPYDELSYWKKVEA